MFDGATHKVSSSPKLLLYITLHYLFIWCLAHHIVHSMDWPLQLFPNGLVDELLSLHGPFSFKLGRHDFHRNVRSIGIVIGAHHLDIVRLQRCLDLGCAHFDHRRVGLILLYAHETSHSVGGGGGGWLLLPRGQG
jgi:hypothetical protein